MAHIQVLKKLHASDIKDGVIYENRLYTVGRDRVVHISSLPDLESVGGSENLGAPINSVCIHNAVLYAGLQTGEIVRYAIEMDENSEESGSAGKKEITLKLLGRSKVHGDNVCSLSSFDEGVISTSWDGSVGVIKENQSPEVIRIESVAWSAKKVPNEDTIIAGCIDGSICTIKKVNGRYTQVKGIKLHATCIRDICMENDRYATVSNTGVVIVTERNGRVLHKMDLNNTSFRINKYTAGNATGYIVSADEGMVYLLSETLESLFSIAAPTLSCWNALSENGRIFALGADGRVYVFADKEGNPQYQKELEELQNKMGSDKVQDTAPPAQKQAEDANSSPQYKVIDDKVYELKDGEWELFGSTVEKKKKDHTITITLGEANYTLSFDKTDKYEEVALGFVKENNLGTEYIPEIVEFLDKNFGNKKKRDVSKYFMYDTIDLDIVGKKIQPLPNSSTVIEFLQGIKNGKSSQHNESDVEVILSEWMEMGTEKVAVLDVYKYLIAKGVDINLSFLKHIDPFFCKKVALVFSLISTNVLAMRPECKSLVDNTMTKIIDKQLVNSKVLQNYKNNRRL
ncbi:phospholipase A-2-activating protein [Nematocida parisii]|uniref:PFU domain-containing protein n=1 Tax=Nematocida parisii (strain ERTm3) TaxID=935791 RepID=I3EEQ2_NEMP3|nr:uncharacterized protein NEPG_02328 [Nematocida parisii ERTm1]EIJ87699.1 hypothetical protein NEQG_02246 [Nematocida parisii ERTm3]KAI5127730.1 phospholipase A-2-activating protein [Nematocida parisii]EIJ92929.1 hypothetical protein NEPG_02328 [Nematocida parisii ERTm1]KAI5128900.1 phospholipase A-2-activating protein [Nematocida parisii]KAI5141571.1 phospholipase A-2-activating protein [Nematocida parisii]|eukprot:XP_013060155.1 hypothetical protein NEPG_02328 [Nematocida parisii ERTm1]